MARPPLVLGTWGKVSRVKRGTTWVAFARFRDFDGVTRLVERKGTTGRQAEDALVSHLRDRTRLHGADLTADSKISELGTQWFDALLAQKRAASTVQAYRRSLDNHIVRALGDVRLRETTVPVVDRFLAALTKSPGPSAAKTARVVLAGMCALAVRHGAMGTNPVREAQTVHFEKREVQAVPVAEVPLLRQRLAAWDAETDLHGRPRTTDLADVVDMFLATGARTGEVLALRWTDLDLQAELPTVTIQATAVQVTGRPLFRQEHPKTDTSNRTLPLPAFAVAMLLRRFSESHTDWVFPSSTGTLRAPNNMRRQWRDFRTHHGYEDWVVPKTFRKSVATHLRDELGIDVASEQLGHSSVAVTKKHYAARAARGPDTRHVLDAFARAIETGAVV